MTAEELWCYFPTYLVCHRMLASLFVSSLMFIQQIIAVLYISCAIFLLGDYSTTFCSCVHATKEASSRICTSNFEMKITSRECTLLTETEDVLKKIYNSMKRGEQIPLI